ncbi:MAG: Intracellular septation protein [Proteobacteria bacterium]|nr:Intracellular septation protein [Pseudomonadota bacterium]
MKFLFDLLPVIFFVVAYLLANGNQEAAHQLTSSLLGSKDFLPAQAPFLIATIVVIATTVLQVTWVKLRHGKVDKMLWFSFFLITATGGLTLFLKNALFFQWKPTLLYWAFALALLVAELAFGKNPMRSLMGDKIELPEAAWKLLSRSWVGFFVFMGALNLIVVYNFSQDFWVKFKLACIGFTFVFAIVQAVLMAKYVEEKP